MRPLIYGHYPPLMRKYVGKRLPKFTQKQSLLLQGSIDFLGFNYYTAAYVSDSKLPPNLPWPESYSHDMRIGLQSMFIYFQPSLQL